ncbi:uncharacterized protein LOC129221481 [Uloborus diversus]|uniref:uncharacterized protein LOC129221481 n=1 Tax=Uloborus diversus TaxID=327109 RepID=UPI0024094993|nr:uncharacterized protein LOC129221481 [Uloborus diversus]
MANLRFLILIIAFSYSICGIMSEISLTCDFERDTCGFTNQEGLLALWVRKEMSLGGREGNVMGVETNGSSVQLARMMTPYFDDVHGTVDACLSFDYFKEGEGVRSFSVQQERKFGITPIWLLSKPGRGWQTPTVSVEVDEDSRFFFDAVLDASLENTTLAIDNMKVKLSKC